MLDKQEKIVKMFDDIASSYDVANRLISLGIDSSWRKKAIKLALNSIKDKHLKIADVATGTGDMLNLWQEEAKKNGFIIDQIYGIDPSKNMLEIAKKKVNNAIFLNSFASNLSLEDKSIDILSISYGIRNVVDLKGAIKEFNRVLKDDALLVILEFTKDTNKNMMHSIKDFYVNRILPKIGAFVSKNKEAYEYLPNSIEHFLDKDAFINLLKEFNFKIEIVKDFSFGVSSLFIARK